MVVFYSAVQITSNLMEEKKASAWNDLLKVKISHNQLFDREDSFTTPVGFPLITREK